MTGKGDYILRMDRRSFSNVRVKGAHLLTDHWMVLAVLQGEGALHNCRYVGESTR